MCECLTCTCAHAHTMPQSSSRLAGIGFLDIRNTHLCRPTSSTSRLSHGMLSWTFWMVHICVTRTSESGHCWQHLLHGMKMLTTCIQLLHRRACVIPLKRWSMFVLQERKECAREIFSSLTFLWRGSSIIANCFTLKRS